MIISHRYRFIFIKTLKTAGTSIEVFLSQQCAQQDIFTPIYPALAEHQPRNYGQFFNHASAFFVRQCVSAELWNSYYKFCVERNPWDKTVSHYSMEKERSGGVLTFDDYLARNQFSNSYALYTDEDDETVLVDRILRYENLDQELTEVFAQLGVPFSGQLTVRAKSGHRKDKRSYQEFYTPEQREMVAQAFAWEVSHLGYRFSEDS